MDRKGQEEFKEVIWFKSIIYFIILIALLVFIFITPKNIFDDNMSFKLASSMSIASDSNFLLYDYQVYGSEERFNEGLGEDVASVKDDFKERNEILAVKINEDDYTLEIKEDYIFITDPEVPELNIEYYLVKDIEFNDITVPARTFIMLFNDVSSLVNNIYIAVYWVFFIIVFTPISIKFTRNVVYLKKHYNNKNDKK